jgi:DNA-binding beta-propeller fold protein YncE
MLSCSQRVAKTAMKPESIVFPAPPDTTRIQFLTSISSSENAVGKQSGFSRFLLGQTLPKVIKKPYGIAVKRGKIYICDTGLGGLEIIDLERNTFDLFVPQGKGELKLPLNCFVDDEGSIYVADGERRQVVIFDKDRHYVNAVGTGDDFKPTDVFVYDHKIWVPNIKSNQINVYDKESLSLLYTFPHPDSTRAGELYSPTNIFVTPGKVYVSDMGDFNVKIYTPEGQYLESVGKHGSSVGQFARPKGIAVDDQSNLYVVDAGFENCQVFNRSGKVLMYFGGPYNGPGTMWLPAKVAVDYDDLQYFKRYVDPAFRLDYLIFVTNQYGPDKVSVYGAVDARYRDIEAKR